MAANLSPHRLECVLGVGIALSVSFLLLIFYPGGMSIDSYGQLLQARHGAVGDWHPPMMAWVWRMADAVLQGPLLMLIAQLLIFVAALMLFAKRAVVGSDGTRRLFVLCSLWVPPIIGIIGVIWKDIWTSCLLLLCFALNLSVRSAPSDAARARRFAWGALAALGALLFRYNAAAAVVPLLVHGAWELAGTKARGSRRAAIAAVAGGAGTVTLLLISAGINRALTAEREFPVQSVLIFDIAGVAAGTGRTDLLGSVAPRLPDVLRGRQDVSIESIRSRYFASTWTPLVFEEGSPLAVTRSAEQVETLNEVWRRAVREEPAKYLNHRAGVFKQVIGWGGAPLFAPVYFGIPESSPDYPVVRRNFQIESGDIHPLRRFLRDALTRTTLWVIYRPWFWLALNLVLMTVALRVSARRMAMLALGMSGLLYEATLFVVAPSADYRYSHWLVLSTWSMLAALVSEVAPRLARRTRALGRLA